eukprot:TRINITY_DN23512_c0_g1_i1.p1 TRINITY_DN23512_c0_g1~~TRINITY_DN23512_c0_g1_i1.p1  ORF type:complete len:226 (+),score=67.94 TRINITY_DN23512_c0_g1_i1:96-680(+)
MWHDMSSPQHFIYTIKHCLDQGTLPKELLPLLSKEEANKWTLKCQKIHIPHPPHGTQKEMTPAQIESLKVDLFLKEFGYLNGYDYMSGGAAQVTPSTHPGHPLLNSTFFQVMDPKLQEHVGNLQHLLRKEDSGMFLVFLKGCMDGNLKEYVDIPPPHYEPYQRDCEGIANLVKTNSHYRQKMSDFGLDVFTKFQ